jgi:uncharacterized membrane protein
MSSLTKSSARIVLAAFMIYASLGHFTNTTSFLAQVPLFVPAKEMIVYISGVFEIGLGLGLLLSKRYQSHVGIALAIFYLAIFPGNISQFLTQTSAFGLDTDLARGIRLLFQPVLVVWALWCTNSLPIVTSKYRQLKN